MEPKGKKPHDKCIPQYNLIESSTTVTRSMKLSKSSIGKNKFCTKENSLYFAIDIGYRINEHMIYCVENTPRQCLVEWIAIPFGSSELD